MFYKNDDEYEECECCECKPMKDKEPSAIDTFKVGDRVVLTQNQDSLGRGSLGIIKWLAGFNSKIEVLRAHDYDGDVLSHPWDGGHQCGHPSLFPRRHGKYFGYNVAIHRLRLETGSFVNDDDILLL